ncbi:MAG: hypothetical protein IJS19_06440 [Muribaculaceae bacterium]|nr:hypothetical protein [Muribaculaceae bacterium]
MTQHDLQNSLGAFAEYLEQEKIDLLAVAFLEGKAHVARVSPTGCDLCRLLGDTMRRDEEFKNFILTAVGYCILPPMLNYINEND